MHRRLLWTFALLVGIPLLVVAWLGIRLAEEREARAVQGLEELLRSTLRSLDGEIQQLLERHRLAIRQAVQRAPGTRDGYREIRGRLPIVRQVFAVDRATGELLYPSLMDDLDREEEAFLRRTRDLWARGALLRGAEERPAAVSAGTGGPHAGGAWETWFWGDGLHLIHWWQPAAEATGGGEIVGAELSRIRLLADIVAAMPDSDPLAPDLEGASIRLVDSGGTVVYQWGALEPGDGERPIVRSRLSPPLAAWSLEYFFADPAGGPAGRLLYGWLPWLLLLVALVVALATYFFRESSRELREAAQRVSFVNQVSHELKTPLTNIRLYAELLDESLPDDLPGPRRHLRVIVAESQRLSRLILNILTFSRRQRQGLALRPRPGRIDEVIHKVIELFRPSLEAEGLEIALDLDASRPAHFDPDVLEQILGNLVNNVEKYSAGGGRLAVESRQAGETVTVRVTDAGPGIPPGEEERIFLPFHRLGNALSDRATGTGIGLSIARDLARAHGGELELEPVTAGARFRLQLRCGEGETEAEREVRSP